MFILFSSCGRDSQNCLTVGGDSAYQAGYFIFKIANLIDDGYCFFLVAVNENRTGIAFYNLYLVFYN